MRNITITGKKETKEQRQETLFWEILLEEKYVGEGLAISGEDLRRAGGVNPKIDAKKDYELLLRVVKNYEVEVTEIQEGAVPEDQVLIAPTEPDSLCDLKTDCYVIGKYKDDLLAAGYFNPAVENILFAAKQDRLEEEIIPCLEQMISRAESYYEIDDATRPVLIYKGSNVCHNVLNVFADAFGAALEKEGQAVEYYDIESRPIGEITELVGRRYRAVVGIQTYAFTIRMKDGETWLHNLIGGKKFNFVFDHPIWMLPHLQHGVTDFCVLTHDFNYAGFIEQYYGKAAYILPPAGILARGEESKTEEKKYDLSFVGTYGDYIHEINLIHGMERRQRFLANHFLLVMRKNPNLTAEKALEQTLRERDMTLSKEEFLEQFYQLRRVIYCVMHYYRYLVLKAILEAGLRLDVFGDSWQHCPLRKYDNLICHPNVTVEESLAVWGQSKLSLNIMSWHKAGFTERIANSMLQGAVVVTDKSDYLEKDFKNEEEILMFDLREISALPDRIKKMLEDDAGRGRIAEAAKKKALQEHTWQARAKEFLRLLE